MDVEIWAAVSGAVVGAGCTGLSTMNRQGLQHRDSFIRLASAVDNLVARMDDLHSDIKARDRDFGLRLSHLERAVARLEARGNESRSNANL